MSRVLPILFNNDMVRAILDGRKTVTRRLVNPQPQGYFEVNEEPLYIYDTNFQQGRITPPYQPGDIIYVRETIWQKVGHYLDVDGETKPSWCKEFKYVATDGKPETGWNYSWATRPSIHMPKDAARIFLKVKDVRVERLQEMSDNDCEKEGLENFCKKCSALFSDCDTCLNDGGIKEDFKELWNSTIKKSDLDRYGWDANPWVWVIEFDLTHTPVLLYNNHITT